MTKRPPPEKYLRFTPDRPWTPGWDDVNQQRRDVTDVLKPNGRYHHFRSMVSMAEADAFLAQPKDAAHAR